MEETGAEGWASLAVLTQLGLLGLTLTLGQWLDKKHVQWLSDAGVALLLGVVMGILSKVVSFSVTYASWMRFSTNFFFIALLPPIMFEAGFSLQVKPFFRNIGAICSFAFAGTIVSTFVIGTIIFAFGLAGAAYSLTFVESLLFGSILSTTDTVTVIAVMQRLGANEDLYATVFGESCLNDAVGIVLYRTLTIFLSRSVNAGSIFLGIGAFLGVFIGSMSIGVGIAFLASLLFKTKFLRHRHMPLESCMVVLIAFSSYMLADGFGLSGIVSILFCGLVSAHYVRPNISRNARDRTAAFFKVLSMLAEIFVFIYIGTSFSTETDAWKNPRTWSTLVFALIALGMSRAANIYPCAAMVNCLRPPEMKIPQTQQFMLWFAGMRGAMAFAMSLRAIDDLPPGKGHTLLVITFFVVLITVLFNGGAAGFLMVALKLRGVDDDERRQKALIENGDGQRHVHIHLDADAAEGVERSGNSGASSIMSGYDSEHDIPSRSTSFTKMPGDLLNRSLTSLRKMSKTGVLSKLEQLDERYLQNIFIGAHKPGDIQMSDMNAHGDDDESPAAADHHSYGQQSQQGAAAAGGSFSRAVSASSELQLHESPFSTASYPATHVTGAKPFGSGAIAVLASSTSHQPLSALAQQVSKQQGSPGKPDSKQHHQHHPPTRQVSTVKEESNEEILEAVDIDDDKAPLFGKGNKSSSDRY